MDEVKKTECENAMLPEDEKCGKSEESINAETSEELSNTASGIEDNNKSSKIKDDDDFWDMWSWSALLSLVCSIITLIVGIYKMYVYNNGDSYPYELKNAYVGGDAYNYIINGTYATAFFVLTAMFFIGAIGLVGVHYLSVIKKNLKTKSNQKVL